MKLRDLDSLRFCRLHLKKQGVMPCTPTAPSRLGQHPVAGAGAGRRQVVTFREWMAEQKRTAAPTETSQA